MRRLHIVYQKVNNEPEHENCMITDCAKTQDTLELADLDDPKLRNTHEA